MKHIAIALAMLAALAIEVNAQDDTPGYLFSDAGTTDLGIQRSAAASTYAASTPRAGMKWVHTPMILGRDSVAGLDLHVSAQGGWGASLTLELADTLVEDEAGTHVDVGRSSARSYQHGGFLAIVGAKRVGFDIIETDETDLDVEATGRSRIYLLNPWGRIIDMAPAFSRIDGTAHGTIVGSVRVYTPGAYAAYALKFFDGTLTARNLAADENAVLVGPGEGAWVEIDPVSMYLYLIVPPRLRVLARAWAPAVSKTLVSLYG